MRKYRQIISIFIGCLLLPIQVLAASPGRVIYDFKQLTNHSGKIELYWHKEGEKNIQIISYYVNQDNVMEVTYRVGNDIPEGFQKMTIFNPKVIFPIPIVLKEQQVEKMSLTDLPEDKEKQYDIISLYDQGIVNGYVDKTFKPGHSVKRAEFFAMLVAAADYELDDDVASTFTDVANDYWGKKYIMALVKKDIVKGSGNGLCKPLGDITIGEVLAIIDRTFIFHEQTSSYLLPDKNHWSNPYYISASKAGILKQSDAFVNPYTPDMKATRQQCASLLSRVLLKGYTIR
ncbi:S-layer homology domain-containing protein [Vallitalea pronyensis]|uniref:S-layer homology domain-containing protein n=1 Tax=Vallitalea pronyensis TaxID=1348613 RepID=A0A8J8MG09_9FIRM|nr:S-layer homology domain-containing protein [Vallitalea pronyensis]QUI20871.1 S-layer homology domain-containing protein [Vallitalea pronyensis]